MRLAECPGDVVGTGGTQPVAMSLLNVGRREKPDDRHARGKACLDARCTVFDHDRA